MQPRKRGVKISVLNFEKYKHTLDRVLKALVDFRSFQIEKRDSRVSTIKQALAKLKSSVSKLEISMHNHEYALAGQQRDMFSEKSKSEAGPLFDTAVISQRLDKAIKKVEELLES